MILSLLLRILVVLLSLALHPNLVAAVALKYVGLGPVLSLLSSASDTDKAVLLLKELLEVVLAQGENMT